MPNISIIIPSYHSEKTIGYCLDSILKQTFKDFECLVIDYNTDGKTQIEVNKYSDKDTRIKYLSSPIQGAIAQREHGIKNANGKYITFVDSDDIIHPYYCEYLYKALIENDVDFACCGIKRVDSPDHANEIINKNNITYSDIAHKGRHYKKLTKDYRQYIGAPSCCYKLIKKEIALMATKYYNSSLSINHWEDAIFSMYILMNSRSVSFITCDELYYYIYNSSSTTRKGSDYDKYLDDCYQISNTLEIIIKEGLYPHNRKQSSFYAVSGLTTYLIQNYYEYNIKGFRKLFRELRIKIKNYVKIKDIQILRKEYSKSEKLIAFSIKYGFSYFCINIARHLKRNSDKKSSNP